MGLVGAPRQLADKAKDAVSGFGSGGGGGGGAVSSSGCVLFHPVSWIVPSSYNSLTHFHDGVGFLFGKYRRHMSSGL